MTSTDITASVPSLPDFSDINQQQSVTSGQPGTNLLVSVERSLSDVLLYTIHSILQTLRKNEVTHLKGQIKDAWQVMFSLLLCMSYSSSSSQSATSSEDLRTTQMINITEVSTVSLGLQWMSAVV